MADAAVDDLVREASDANTNRNEPAVKGGRAVAALVDLHGLSFDEVAERTGIPRGTAHRWSAPFRVKDEGGTA